MTQSRLLFILKRREMTYEEDNILNQVNPDKPNNPYFKYCMSSGLRNSAAFVVGMLNKHGIKAKIVEVIDNNCIDKEVSLFKPTHVIIEAYWVVPEKFEVLTKLHPTVEWIIRNHSELPFLANEGIAVDWTMRYIKYRNVFVAPNSLKSYEDIKKMVTAATNPFKAEYKVLYLPNYYKIKKELRDFQNDSDMTGLLNVGCFGAVRPLKNHLVQAVAAVDYARQENKKLNFHINVARIEDAGNNALKSLRGFFKNLNSDDYQLIEHGWLDHDDFLKLVRNMDFGLQASFTESFNIVCADFVSQGVPIVVSEEIEWMPQFTKCRHTDSKHIVKRIRSLLRGFRLFMKARIALCHLNRYNSCSVEIWTTMFRSIDY